MKTRTIVLAIVVPVALLAAALTAAITLGGPGVPPPMPSINDPFKGVSFVGLPALSRFTARDGVPLGYRAYAAGTAPSTTPARGSVVLVHGSSASSNSMHPMAQAFAQAGYAVFALDIRGHGESGTKGRIAYVGQLEDDLEDFVKAVSPPKPATLAGFSAGGGFAMRVAGSPRQRLFQNYLFLSPFIGQDAPTYRPDSGGWVSVGLPRIVAISLLNGVGVRWFNDLPVTRFALNEQAKAFLTPEYTFALATNFRPQADYVQNIKAMEQPGHVLAGTKDEAFFADRFAEVFRSAGSAIPVTLVPEVGHIQLTLRADAIAAAVKAVEAMRLGGT
jgi:non-heme chloroperoxidase